MDKLIKAIDKNFSISLVVPIFNEVGSIPTLLDHIEELDRYIKKTEKIVNYEFILIDDASGDNSSLSILSNINEEILKEKVILKRHEANFGYGAAIQSGIYLAKYDWVITFDADGQHTPEAITKILDELLSPNCPFLLIGTRYKMPSYSLRALGRRFLNWSEIILLGSELNDSNSGLKCFKKDVYRGLENIIPAPIDMSFSQYLAQMFHMLSDVAVKEVFIETSERNAGESKIRPKDFFVALRQNLRLSYLLKPKRLFYALALSLLGMALPYSLITIILNKQGMPVAGGIATIIGFCFIILGELRQTVSERKLASLNSELRVKYLLSPVDKI